MKIQSKAVHSGDRGKPATQVPVTTPIYSSSSFIVDTSEELDKILGVEAPGFCYARYDNPTNCALEELVRDLENGAGALACASGMSALQVALTAALLDRRKSIVAADALYGATIKLMMNVLAPFGVEVRFVDICNLQAVERAIAEEKPGCVVMETISNPLLRVGHIARVAEMTRSAGGALLVDNTFATPLMVRPEPVITRLASSTVAAASKYWMTDRVRSRGSVHTRYTR